MWKALPDPYSTGNAPHCPYCGYAREGLGGSAPCPECGKVVPERMYVVHGNTRGLSGASTSVKLAMIATRIALCLVLLFFAAIVMMFGAVIFFVLAGMLVAVFVAVRGKSGKSGPVRMVFAPGGVFLESISDKLQAAGASKTFIAWRGDEAARIDRISSVWRRLRIRTPATKSTVLDAGIRCPDDSEQAVLAAIEQSIRGVVPVADPQQPAYPSAHMNATRATTTTTNDSTA